LGRVLKRGGVLHTALDVLFTHFTPNIFVKFGVFSSQAKKASTNSFGTQACLFRVSRRSDSETRK
jgi:hypothetical protein